MSINPKQPKAVKGNLSPSERLQDPQAFARTYQAGPLPAELFIPFKNAPGELISSVGDAYIVLGKDRPASMDSGYFGQTNCSTIDMVTGRLGVIGQQVRESKPDLTADNNFMLDAARIYISQRTDVDDNFGLTEFLQKVGSVDGSAKNKSAIALKADGVRLIARESIKLITMTDQFNSTNNNIVGKYGIELIGGANINEPNYDLQSLVKGENMVEAMNKIADHLAQLDTQFALVDKMIAQLTTAMVGHVHVPTIPFTPFTSPPVDPVSISNNVLTYIDNIMQVVEINLRQFNHGAYRASYLIDGSPTYICSKLNKTT